jgi:hypothetical protein
MKRAFWAATAATLLLAGCGFGPKYPSFDNAAYKVEANTTVPGSGQQVATVIYRDGAKMRVETQAPGAQPATIVFDQATNAAYLLQDAAPAAPVATTAGATPPATAAPGATPAAAPAANPNATMPAAPAAPATPVGVAIRVANAEAPQPIEAPWAALGADGAKSLGSCEAAGEHGTEWQPKEEAAGVARTACITDDGIVLRVKEGDAVLYEVTRLERGAQDSALFGIPAGYTLVDPAAVVQSVGETIGQLDSVQGGTPTPATGQTTTAPTTPPH